MSYFLICRTSICRTCLGRRLSGILTYHCPFCVTKKDKKNWLKTFAAFHHWSKVTCRICVICRTPICKIYLKCQPLVIIRQGQLLINKIKQKIIQNICCATTRYFKWFILFCIICRDNLQTMSKNPAPCNLQIKACFGQQENP